MPVLTLIANPVSRDISRELANDIAGQVGEGAVQWLGEACACDIPLKAGRSNCETLVTEMIAEAPIDFAIQKAETRKKQALIADMDSTMIEQECIDELAAEIGVRNAVSEITAKAMNGEIVFDTALEERVALLRGIEASITDHIVKTRITLTPGGETLVRTMRAKGAYTALVSGGFTAFTDRIAGMLGFDENRANVLETENGKLTGAVRKPILGAEAKVDALRDIARTRKLQPADFIAVGDGANDLPMLQMAGTGVALHAKPIVAAKAKICIDHGDLTALLYLQGYSEKDFVNG